MILPIHDVETIAWTSHGLVVPRHRAPDYLIQPLHDFRRMRLAHRKLATVCAVLVVIDLPFRDSLHRIPEANLRRLIRHREVLVDYLFARLAPPPTHNSASDLIRNYRQALDGISGPADPLDQVRHHWRAAIQNAVRFCSRTAHNAIHQGISAVHDAAECWHAYKLPHDSGRFPNEAAYWDAVEATCLEFDTRWNAELAARLPIAGVLNP